MVFPPQRERITMELINIIIKVIGILTILKYSLREGRTVAVELGSFVCSIIEVINKVKNSKNRKEQQRRKK